MPADTVAPKLSRWDYFAREDQLREDAENIPTLRMANVARKLLAGTASDLHQSLPKGTHEVQGLDAVLARKMAATSIGLIAARSCSAAIVLLRSGYEPEALGPTRSVVEADIRVRLISEDHSGEAARQLLAGRVSRKVLNKAARRYGMHEEISLLDRFAHPNPLMLDVNSVDVTPGLPDGYLEIRPMRGTLRPVSQLYALAYGSVTIAVGMCEVFGVALQIPAYLSDRLAYYKDNPIPKPL